MSAPTVTRPTCAQLVAAFGPGNLTKDSLLAFCQVARSQRDALRELAAPEHWGVEDSVLLRYLAVHVRLSIEQGRYGWSGEQIVLRAGRLVTAAGSPIHVGFTQNSGSRPPWALSWVGEAPGTSQALEPVDLGAWPALDPRHEVVVVLDQFRSTELAGLPLPTQNAAVTGAVTWSLRRGLAVRQLRGENRDYLVPVHLTDREAAPEAVAVIHAQAGRLIVRALIEPRAAYAAARAVVEPRSMPAWLREVWEPHGAEPAI